ncbi:hypothetical protein GCM10009078_00850 [Cupriavidus gilardii]
MQPRKNRTVAAIGRARRVTAASSRQALWNASCETVDACQAHAVPTIRKEKRRWQPRCKEAAPNGQAAFYAM